MGMDAGNGRRLILYCPIKVGGRMEQNLHCGTSMCCSTYWRRLPPTMRSSSGFRVETHSTPKYRVNGGFPTCRNSRKLSGVRRAAHGSGERLSGLVGRMVVGEGVPVRVLWLPADSAQSNLAAISPSTHTLSTYHRTWETGLGVEIRVAAFSPDFVFPRR